MKAYKCDRCGKLYEIKKIRGVGTFKSYDITNNPYVSGCLDLCDECFDELQEWMTVYKEAKSEDLSSITSQKLKKAVNSIFGLPSITLQAKASKLTNGDIMKIFFPDIEIEAVKIDDKIIGYDISKLDNLTYFSKGWWDAPYFVESEEEE